MGRVLGGLGRGRSVLAVALSLLLALPSCNAQKRTKYGHARDPDTTRYRLLLRENPVDPAGAMHCYAACQPQLSPRGYLDCLMACPGFDITPQEYCAPDEVPPVAACFTARKIPAKTEPPPGMIVLEVVGMFAIVIAAASLCNSSASHCGNNTFPPPH
ncbi:MAG: hypothetical protein ABJB12_04115 [Pseudomonadota bacterium]